MGDGWERFDEAKPFEYLLTVLTNGRVDCLERTLAAFFAHARPRPSKMYVVDDGGATGSDAVFALSERYGKDINTAYETTGDMVGVPDEAIGMCGAMERCWLAAAESGDRGLGWIFHLEDDQLLLRPINIFHLALVQASTWGYRERALAQMALVRAPWGAEIPHGGYIPKDPGWYNRVGAIRHGGPHEWIETTRNWATSPALYRAELCQEFEWPTEPNCESLIGPRIRERYPEAVFGLWGHGECQYAHIGVERAEGAHGY